MIVGRNAVQEHYEYAPFGEMLTRAEIMAPFLFSSEMFDFEIGISYYNLRQLNSRSGRWLCREPWSMVKGLNLYWFVLNAPISSFDIRGLASSRWGILVDDVDERFRISPYLDYVSVDELLKDPFRGILRDDVIGLIREMGGLPLEEYLSHCPCCIEDANPSDGWTFPEKSGHEGGGLEVRRKFGNNSGGGQQCVYDRSGRLINEGKAAGTPDRVHPDTRINKALHMILDGWPYALFHPIDFIADKLGQDTDLATAVDHWWNPPDKGMDQYGNPCPSNQGP